MSPVRVQRKRTKGWRMPPNTVYVGRGSQWGNPFKPAPVDEGGMTLQQCINAYRYQDQPCHADVLLELANGTKP